jgi:hypothetical protein
MKNLIDYASQDNGTEFRAELYAAIHDKVSAHINSKKQEIASGLMGQQSEEVESLDEISAEEMKNFETRKSARDVHVKQFMDKTGLPKEHAEQYASAVVKYPNNAMAGAEQAADRIAGPRNKVKFHQSPKPYQDKHVGHVKTMKGIMHQVKLPEEYESLDEISADKIIDYSEKAQKSYADPKTSDAKKANRKTGLMTGYQKLKARAKVPATYGED